jgi:predicted RNase H-like HicB family nuclease
MKPKDVVVPDEEDRPLPVARIRAGMRRAMTKCAYSGKAIFLGPYSRGDFLDDIHILVVTERFRRGSIQDSSDLGDCLDDELGEHGAIVMTVRRADFDRQKGQRSTGAWEASHYGIVLCRKLGGHGPRPKFLRPVNKLMFARKSKKPANQAVSKLVLTQEEGKWSAHDPNLQGVWGLGATREKALADFDQAKAFLKKHEAKIEGALRRRKEDEEDVKQADQVWKGIQAGAPVYSHDEVKSMLGMAPTARGRARKKRP